MHCTFDFAHAITKLGTENVFRMRLIRLTHFYLILQPVSDEIEYISIVHSILLFIDSYLFFNIFTIKFYFY